MLSRALLPVLILALVAADAPGSVQAADSRAYARGGSTREFANDVDGYRATGELFRITGHCQSACTMFLALPNACVEPGATLLFHGGKTAEGTERMFNSYNGKLRSYLAARGVMKGPAFHAISGAELIGKFGYRRCPAN